MKDLSNLSISQLEKYKDDYIALYVGDFYKPLDYKKTIQYINQLLDYKQIKLKNKIQKKIYTQNEVFGLLSKILQDYDTVLQDNNINTLLIQFDKREWFNKHKK